MLLHIPSVLTKEEVAHFRRVLEQTQWVDGNITSGVQAALAKRNLQVPQDAPKAVELGEIILRALGGNAMFNSAALPLRVFPPLFNRYDEGMGFDSHVDNSIRYIPEIRQRVRTDVSSTLFLSEPEEYDGGELVIEDTYGEQRVKLPAGDMVLYSADSLHLVEPVRRGSRWASFFWTQSMIREDRDRELLFRMDRSITLGRGELGDKHPAIVGMTSAFHSLMRRWADV
ncbi:MAG: Fe2+-dependent dioxygenase [Pseudomonadota bacterium]